MLPPPPSVVVETSSTSPSVSLPSRRPSSDVRTPNSKKSTLSALGAPGREIVSKSID